MSPTIGELLERLQSAEDALEEAFDARRREMAFILKGRKAVFDEKVAALHRAFRTGIFAYVRGARLSVILSAPAILAVAVPLLLLDLFVIVYQAVCFPVYGLKKVPRSDFIVFDRAQLAYLNIFEKFNCFYCSYANGLLAWVSEIAGLTESYWCPIKHARRIAAMHRHYARFADYGDAEAWRAATVADRGSTAKS